MARGIIATKPGGTTNSGRLLVSDTTDSSGGTSTGTISDSGSGTSTSVSTAAVTLSPGAVINFTDIGSSGIGDLVDFVLGSDGTATKITTVKTGTVISGNYTDNIVVNKGEAVLINGAANVDGKITINGGVLAIVDNSHIEGKIESAFPGSCLFVDSGCTIEGKTEITGASFLLVRNSTVEGKLSSSGNTFASVTGCTIRGKLEVVNATTCKCSGNTVQGQTNTPGCTA